MRSWELDHSLPPTSTPDSSMQDTEKIGRAGEPVRDGPVVVRTYGQGCRDAGGGGVGSKTTRGTPGWLFRGGAALRLDGPQQLDRGPDAVGDWNPTALLRMLPRLRISPSRLLPPPRPVLGSRWCRPTTAVGSCRDEQATRGSHLMVRHRYARAPLHRPWLVPPAEVAVHCRHRAASLFCLTQRGRAGMPASPSLPLRPDRATKRPGGFSEHGPREEGTLSRQSEESTRVGDDDVHFSVFCKSRRKARLRTARVSIQCFCSDGGSEGRRKGSTV